MSLKQKVGRTEKGNGNRVRMTEGLCGKSSGDRNEDAGTEEHQ